MLSLALGAALGLAVPAAPAAAATPVGAKAPASAAPARTAPAAAAREVLPFIADDYAKALAEARARKLPLFIEAWAPW